VLVDSYRFLPRSFVPLYEKAEPLPGESSPVWTPFAPRLADASVALLTSAGLSLRDAQPPFDLERERREPTWGDPSFRPIPHDLAERELVMSHLHVSDVDARADRNVVLPVDALQDLVDEGVVGSAAPTHVSVMGYQQAGLAAWREETAPAVVELLRAQGTDGVVLAPV
jgi:D-proline reductase (dithiol) PrdB